MFVDTTKIYNLVNLAPYTVSPANNNSSMSTLTQLRAVQSANRFQTPQGKGNGANSFAKTHQSPQKASMLFAGTNSTSTNVAHWKKGALSIIRGQSPMLYERIKILTSKQLSDDVAIKIYDDDDHKF